MAASLLQIGLDLSYHHGGRARLRALTGAVDPVLSRFVADAVARVRPDLLHLEGGGLAALLRSTAGGLAGDSLRS